MKNGSKKAKKADGEILAQKEVKAEEKEELENVLERKEVEKDMR